jgi:23S rRNA A1618 N6-methylase RlmF
MIFLLFFSDKQSDFEEKMGEIVCSIGTKSSVKSVVGEISKFDIIVNFIIQKLKSKNTSLKKYTN